MDKRRGSEIQQGIKVCITVHPIDYGSDESISAIELRCVEEGQPILKEGHKRTFYLKTNTITGVCSGEVTSYIFAEWCESGGAIHGRPISEKALRAMGIEL